MPRGSMVIRTDTILHIWLQPSCSLFGHKPLIGLLNIKSQADIVNLRLLRFKEKISYQKFTIFYKLGKTNFFADIALRSPCYHKRQRQLQRSCYLISQSIMEENNFEDVVLATITCSFIKQIPINAFMQNWVKTVLCKEKIFRKQFH